MVIQVLALGVVDYYGVTAKAYREIYANGEWKLVLETPKQQRQVMITY